MHTLLSACPIRGGSLQVDHHQGANYLGSERLPKTWGEFIMTTKQGRDKIGGFAQN